MQRNDAIYSADERIATQRRLHEKLSLVSKTNDQKQLPNLQLIFFQLFYEH